MGSAKTNLELQSALTTHLVVSLLENGAKKPDPALLRLLVMRALAAQVRA